MAVFKLDTGADGRKVVDLRGKAILTIYSGPNGIGKKEPDERVFNDKKFVPVQKLTDIADGTRETTELVEQRVIITLHPDGFHEKVDGAFFKKQMGSGSECSVFESAR